MPLPFFASGGKVQSTALYQKILRGDTGALQTSGLNLDNSRIADYLQFAADFAQTPVNLMDAVLNNIDSGKTGNYVQLSLARYFQESEMLSVPDGRMFGTVLHEWMELYLAKEGCVNHKRVRNGTVKAAGNRLSKKGNPVSKSGAINPPAAAAMPQ